MPNLARSELDTAGTFGTVEDGQIPTLADALVETVSLRIGVSVPGALDDAAGPLKAAKHPVVARTTAVSVAKTRPTPFRGVDVADTGG